MISDSIVTAAKRALGAFAALGLLASCASSIEPPPNYEPSQQYAPAPRASAPQETPARVWDQPALIPPSRPVRVALLVPLSGEAAKLGQSMQDAAILALDDKLRSLPGGLAQSQVVLIPKDTGTDPASAVAAASQALQEGAELILGPLYSAQVSAVAPLARARGVPVVSFSNNKSVAGNGVYILGFLPEQQVYRAVTFALSQGRRKFAALVPNDAYGTTVAEALRQAVFSRGGELGRIEFYDAAAADISPSIRKVAGFEHVDLEFRRNNQVQKSFGEYPGAPVDPGPDFDALLIPEGGARLTQIAAQLEYFEIDPLRILLIGSGQWDDPAIRQIPQLQGAWFAGSSPRAREAFERHFFQSYQYGPERLASLAYDATALAVTLAYAPGGPDFSARALTGAAGFAGPVDGIFRFYPSGVSERGLAVLRVTPRKFEAVDAMPGTF